jgi:hypothetical protein
LIDSDRGDYEQTDQERRPLRVRARKAKPEREDTDDECSEQRTHDRTAPPKREMPPITTAVMLSIFAN